MTTPPPPSSTPPRRPRRPRGIKRLFDWILNTWAFWNVLIAVIKTRRRLLVLEFMPSAGVMWADLCYAGAWYAGPEPLLVMRTKARQSTPRARPCFPWGREWDRTGTLDQNATARLVVAAAFIWLALEMLFLRVPTEGAPHEINAPQRE